MAVKANGSRNAGLEKMKIFISEARRSARPEAGFSDLGYQEAD